jgi:predicted ATPase
VVRLVSCARRVCTNGELGVTLGDRLAQLAKGRRTALPRQRTLLDTKDWSYGLLSESGKTILRRLSIFAGAFSLGAACAIATFGGLSIKAVEDGVGNLVAKSRLSLERDHNLLLYRMLDTTREYFGHADM